MEPEYYKWSSVDDINHSLDDTLSIAQQMILWE
jgi:hypothetical protein